LTDGQLHVGETKDAAQFRQQLEKITGKKQDGPKNKLDQHDFLTLLVTQLKYQDPSKPMEHYEMASQMAQFNTVEQLVGVNKSLTNMSKSQNEAKLDKLSQYLDKYVEVDGNKLKLNTDKTTTTAHFKLLSASSSSSIEIKDEQSKVVKTISLGAMQMGSHDFNWDGHDSKGQALPPGNYSFSLHCTGQDGKPITVKTSYLTQVVGVSDILGSGMLETSAGSLDPTKITAIRTHEQKGKTHGFN
jgi:flagellar basal-body rod modification protein FlgD